MADVTSYKTISRDISSSSYRGFFFYSCSIQNGIPVRKMLQLKKQPFFGNQYPIKTYTKQASIHAKVQFQYTKCLSQIFSVMSIR